MNTIRINVNVKNISGSNVWLSLFRLASLLINKQIDEKYE
mgnify:FL=1